MDNEKFDYEVEYGKLREKQKRWIDYYIETGNATEASRMAKYGGKNLDVIGSENLRKLSKFVEYKLSQKDNERIASQDEVLEYLTRVMRGEEKDAFGLDASLQDRTRCAELLGKRYALFTDRKELTGKDGEKIDVNINVIKE